MGGGGATTGSANAGGGGGGGGVAARGALPEGAQSTSSSTSIPADRRAGRDLWAGASAVSSIIHSS
jgi:hypothetical protein